MKTLHNVMLLLCLLVTVRCSDFKETEPDSGLLTNIDSQSLPEFITAQVQPSEKPERYLVYFSWPKIEDEKRIRIRNGQALVIVKSGQTTFSQEVDHNQNITFSFEVLDTASKVEKYFSKIVTIPRDFVVRKNQNELLENQKLNVKRLFLFSDIPFRTNGFNIEIIADQIISDKGIIETHFENSKAGNSIDGLSGGELTIKANSAIGKLNIVMRGQNGGDGLKGPSFSYRAPDGSPPGWQAKECSCRECPRPTQTRGCYCYGKGPNGTNGSPGAKGFPGSRAGNGGSSGILKIEINDGSGLLLQTFSLKGFAGIPGPGGDGQPGGIAPQSQGKTCEGSPGSNGPTGPQGDSGPIGVDGKPGLICVYIASEGRNDCY